MNRTEKIQKIILRLSITVLLLVLTLWFNDWPSLTVDQAYHRRLKSFLIEDTTILHKEHLNDFEYFMTSYDDENMYFCEIRGNALFWSQFGNWDSRTVLYHPREEKLSYIMGTFRNAFTEDNRGPGTSAALPVYLLLEEGFEADRVDGYLSVDFSRAPLNYNDNFIDWPFGLTASVQMTGDEPPVLQFVEEQYDASNVPESKLDLAQSVAAEIMRGLEYQYHPATLTLTAYKDNRIVHEATYEIPNKYN